MSSYCFMLGMLWYFLLLLEEMVEWVEWLGEKGFCAKIKHHIVCFCIFGDGFQLYGMHERLRTSCENLICERLSNLFIYYFFFFKNLRTLILNGTPKSSEKKRFKPKGHSIFFFTLTLFQKHYQGLDSKPVRTELPVFL